MAKADDRTFDAAVEIAEEARRKSSNINVKAVVLQLAHPEAPPAGRWKTLALCFLLRDADLIAADHRTRKPDVGIVVVSWDRDGALLSD